MSSHLLRDSHRHPANREGQAAVRRKLQRVRDLNNNASVTRTCGGRIDRRRSIAPDCRLRIISIVPLGLSFRFYTYPTPKEAGHPEIDQCRIPGHKREHPRIHPSTLPLLSLPAHLSSLRCFFVDELAVSIACEAYLLCHSFLQQV